MVRNALESIRDMTYSDWHLAFIDDGSQPPGKPIVEEVLNNYLDKITFYRIEDSVQQKINQGGSRHPEFMNKAILESSMGDEDVVIILCDDDAIIPDYLEKLSPYYSNNPDVIYSYCHCAPYNPLIEKINQSFIGRSFGYNHTHPLFPCGVVDSAQVTYRKKAFTQGGLRYPSPATVALDASIYSLLARYGPAPHNGIVGQYKGWFQGQLGNRGDLFTAVDTEL